MAKRTQVLENILRHRFFPGILKWPTFIIFIGIFLLLSFGDIQADNNLGSSLTWLLWWALLPVAFLSLGRIWCAICPFSTLSDLVQNVVGNNLKPARFLKVSGLWIICGLFLILTWSEEVFEIVDLPRATGIFLMVIFTGALALGAFYERRSWCRYLCPLGGLAGVYSRTSFIALRGNSDICSNCSTVSCYKGTEKIPGCSMAEFPRVMDSNMYCNFCGDCIKNCPNDSISVYLRNPSEEISTIKRLRVPEAFIAVSIMALMIIQNSLEGFKPFIESGISSFGFGINFTFYYVFVLSVTLLVFLFFAHISSIFNKSVLKSNFIIFGISMVPLVLFLQLAHNINEFFGEGMLIVHNIKNSAGIASSLSGTSILDEHTIIIIQVVLMLSGLALSVITYFKLAKNQYKRGQKSITTALWLLLLSIMFGVNFFLTFFSK